jgi:hypothetical protein
MKRAIWIAAALLAALSVSGCCCCFCPSGDATQRVATKVAVGPAQRESHQVGLDDATSADVTVQFAGGTLHVQAGAGDLLLDGEFIYNLQDLEPLIEYTVDEDIGALSVRHRADSIRWDPAVEVRNEWHLRLGTLVPTEMRFDVGASTGTLDLSGLRLTRLDILAGAADMTVRFDEPNPERLEALNVRSGAARLNLLGLGNANAENIRFDGGLGSYTFDLSGEWQRSAQVDILAGASQVVLSVPTEIGVRVCAGDVRRGDYGGLVERGDCYVNALYEQADIQLDIDLDLGLGYLEIRQTD